MCMHLGRQIRSLVMSCGEILPWLCFVSSVSLFFFSVTFRCASWSSSLLSALLQMLLDSFISGASPLTSSLASTLSLQLASVLTTLSMLVMPFLSLQVPDRRNLRQPLPALALQWQMVGLHPSWLFFSAVFLQGTSSSHSSRFSH